MTNNAFIELPHIFGYYRIRKGFSVQTNRMVHEVVRVSPDSYNAEIFKSFILEYDACACALMLSEDEQQRQAPEHPCIMSVPHSGWPFGGSISSSTSYPRIRCNLFQDDFADLPPLPLKRCLLLEITGIENAPPPFWERLHHLNPEDPAEKKKLHFLQKIVDEYDQMIGGKIDRMNYFGVENSILYGSMGALCTETLAKEKNMEAIQERAVQLAATVLLFLTDLFEIEESNSTAEHAEETA